MESSGLGPGFNHLSLPQQTFTGEDAPPSLNAKPTRDAHGRTLNPRSCVTCRKRKVKCDKVHPCANCSRAHIECIFPAPGRAPRRLKKPGEGRDKELLERLRRLEGVVKGLGADVQNGNVTGTPDSGNDPQTDESQLRRQSNHDRHAHGNDDDAHTEPWVESPTHNGSVGAGGLEQSFGRLVVDQGRSRYISLSFWANLSNEVEDIKGILNQSSEEDEGFEGSSIVDSPASSAYVPSQGWIFGFSSNHVDMLNLHPLPPQVLQCWDIFKDRVDPIVKVLHIPTVDKQVSEAIINLSQIPKSTEALLFAIYYAAATSLSSNECLEQFGEERSVLLTRYRFATEQALARAGLLISEEHVVLQAFVLFLLCLRRNSDARMIWTLTGLLLRIAQTMGIHRDGTNFGLPPLETELRRRLWWQICMIDMRASEDHGCDPTIVEDSFDTRMPLNIPDSDLAANMRETPVERDEWTEMSFSLMRFESFRIQRRIYFRSRDIANAGGEHRVASLQDKERWIAECHQRIEERYLKSCNISIPLQWMTATVARLIMSKMWLTIYHPFHRQDGGKSLSQDIREKLFLTALENIEYINLLETEQRTAKWGWLFKTYMHWYMFAFILTELCLRTKGDLVDRAWTAVETARIGRWDDDNENMRAGHLWRPLKRLYRKAREARRHALAQESLLMGVKGGLPDSYFPTLSATGYNPPDITRAPLSNAPPLRTAQLPNFGDLPAITPTPRGTCSENQQMGTPELNSAVLGQNARPMNNGAGQISRMSANNISDSPLNTAGSVNYSFMGRLPTNPLQYTNPEHIPPIGINNIGQTPLRTNSDGSVMLDATDYALMDASNQVSLENWDQIVRGFGMDIDSAGSGSEGAGWAGPGWDPNFESARISMGMGGDWF